MSVKILIDSTVNVRPERKDRFLTVPLTVRFGGEEFLDGVTIDHKTFYEKLLESKELPTTSQATPDAFSQAYAQAKEDSLVVLTIASKLSGTCQSALIAAQDYDNVYVVDTCTTTIGAGLLAELALKMADEGAEATQIVTALEQARERVELVALFDTLEYLKRGGRVSKTAAVAGALLNIKPLIRLADGQLSVLGKARGTKQGCDAMDQQVDQLGGIDRTMPLILGYTGLSDENLKKYISSSSQLQDVKPEYLDTVPIGSVVGTHAGPDAFAIAFFRK